MVVCEMDLQLPVKLMPITIKVVSSNPVHCEVYSIQPYVIKFVDFSGYSGFLEAINQISSMILFS
jgi:hypothetical protein